MGKSPAFQFYPRDFIADTAHLTNEEVGIYCRWLCHAWIGIGHCPQGVIPDDPEILRRLVGVGRKKMRSTGAKVKKFFRKVEQGKLENKRLVEEREKQEKRRLQAQQAGFTSAAKRKEKATTVGTGAQRPLEFSCPPVERKPNSASASASADVPAADVEKAPETTSPMSKTNGRSPGVVVNGEFNEARLAEAARRVKGAIACPQSIPRIEDEVLAACLRSDHKPEDVASRADEKYKSYRGHDVWDFCRAEFPPKGNRGQDWVDGVIRRTKEQWRRMQDKKG